MAAFVPPANVPGELHRHSASDFYRLLSVQDLWLTGGTYPEISRAEGNFSDGK